MSAIRRERLAQTSACSALALDQDGAVLVTGGEDGRIAAWQLGATKPVDPLYSFKVEGDGVDALTVAESGRSVLGAQGSRVVAFTIAGTTAEPGPRVQHNGDDVSALVCHPVQPLVAACDDDGCVALLDSRSLKLRGVGMLRRGHTNMCACAVWLHPSSTQLLTGAFDQCITWWDDRGAVRCTVNVAQAILESEADAAAAVLPPAAAAAAAASASDEADADLAAMPRAKRREEERKRAKLKAKSGKKSGKKSDGGAGADAAAMAPQGQGPAYVSNRGGQMLNPPFVFHMALSPCRGWLAVALGDGTLVVLRLADTGGGDGAAAAASSGSGGGGGGSGSGSGGSNSNNSSALLRVAWWSECYTAAVTSVGFLHLSNGTLAVWCAANDGCIRLWPWHAVQAAAQDWLEGRYELPAASAAAAAAATPSLQSDAEAEAVDAPAAPAPRAVPLLLTLQHKRGPNAVLASPAAGGIICVCDISKFVTLYYVGEALASSSGTSTAAAAAAASEAAAPAPAAAAAAPAVAEVAETPR